MSRAHQRSKLQLAKHIVPTDDNTVGVWHFDNHLYSTRGVKPVTQSNVMFGASGKFGSAVNVSTGAVLEYPESIWNVAEGTFSCWAKSSIANTTKTIFYQWAIAGSSAGHFGLSISSTNYVTFDWGNSRITSSFPVDTTQWHNYVITWKDGTDQIYIYIDGEIAASASATMTMDNTGGRKHGTIPLGHRGWTYRDQWWNGLIDEVRWDMVARTPQEIQSWYKSQSPFYDPMDTTGSAQ